MLGPLLSCRLAAWLWLPGSTGRQGSPPNLEHSGDMCGRYILPMATTHSWSRASFPPHKRKTCANQRDMGATSTLPRHAAELRGPFPVPICKSGSSSISLLSADPPSEAARKGSWASALRGSQREEERKGSVSQSRAEQWAVSPSGTAEWTPKPNFRTATMDGRGPGPSH